VAHIHPPHLADDEKPPARQLADEKVADTPKAPARGLPQSRWLLKIGLEVLLISMGVFLALMGEQWRENAHTRDLAEASLQRFRAEIVANRKAVAAVKDYHVTTLKSLEAYLAADPKARQATSVEIKGLQPVFFERTAWDLALATQSLANIDPQVAFALSRIYGTQQTYTELTRAIMQAMYLRPITESFEALSYYFSDITRWERSLLQMYDEVLVQMDRR
jgi:hypothetical protein